MKVDFSSDPLLGGKNSSELNKVGNNKQSYKDGLKSTDVDFLNELNAQIKKAVVAQNKQKSQPSPVIDSKPPQYAANSPISKVSSKEKVAQEFEAMMINMMLKTMRKGVGDFGIAPKSNGRKIYESMLDTEYANVMSKTGEGLGIRKMVLEYLNRADNVAMATNKVGPVDKELDSTVTDAIVNSNKSIL